jgi:hypothetical protein
MSARNTDCNSSSFRRRQQLAQTCSGEKFLPDWQPVRPWFHWFRATPGFATERHERLLRPPGAPVKQPYLDPARCVAEFEKVRTRTKKLA